MRRLINNLSFPPINYFLALTIIFLLLFAVFRLILLLTNFSQFEGVPFIILIESFLVGIRFDLSVTLYALVPLFLLNYLLYLFGQEKRIHTFNLIYLSLISGLYIFLCVSEIHFFNYFHIRLNAYFVNWGDNPGFIIKMIWQTYPVIPFLLLISLTTFFIIWTLKRIQNKIYFQDKQHHLYYKTLAFLFIAPFIFFGIRGTLGYKSPLRWGHAYFSEYNSANQLALNGIFSLADDILYQKKNLVNLKEILQIQDEAQCEEMVQKLISDSTGKFVHFPLRDYQFKQPPNKRNIVIILLESFSDYGIRKCESDGIPLYFNKIKNQGIYFPHFYSNGFHTSMGIFTSLFGMPSVLGKTILVRNEGQQEFSGIINILGENGYQTYFGVSHDPYFENMAGFLRANGAEHIISQFDFSPSEALSKLGVADHKLFEKMNDEFKKAKEPFLGIMLSTNNHGPWIIPPVTGKKFISTFDYTDWALEHFLELASQEDYFKNTIFVITGDHGKAMTPGYDFNLQATHIPCLIYNPNFIKPRVIQNICGHIDLTQTLLGMLHLNYQTTNFGRDVLHLADEDRGFVLMQENNTLGFIYDAWYLIDRIEGNSSLYKYKSETPFKDCGAEYPEIEKDLKEKARAVYIMGNELILNRKVAPQKWIVSHSPK